MSGTGRSLHVTSPLMTGPDVKAAQKKLAALGYPAGPADGQYGITTSTALRSFQLDHGLTPDGIDGPRTSLALAGAHPKPPAAHIAAGSSPGLLGLAEAVKWIGTTESPAGSNRNRFGAWFDLNGVPWCNIFVSYCFETGAGITICHGFAGPGVTAKGCAYVPSTEAWLRATGQWIGRTEPRPGDIAIYNWDGGVPDHIGIVESASGDGFTAIEGNTSSASDSNGGQVERRERTLANVDGFGRIRG